jgi:hypothetical protein
MLRAPLQHAPTQASVAKAPAANATAKAAAGGPEFFSHIEILGHGEALAPRMVRRFSTPYGADLSGVRVHRSAPIASALGASAFAWGNHIAFAPHRYRPDRRDGMHLIGHELAHVAQQARGRGAFADAQLGDGYEQQADRAARSVMTGDRPAALSALPGPQVQCFDEDAPEPDEGEVVAGDDAWAWVTWAAAGIDMVPKWMLPPGLAASIDFVKLVAPHFASVWALLNDTDRLLDGIRQFVEAQLPLVPGLARDYVTPALQQLGLSTQHAAAIAADVAQLGIQMVLSTPTTILRMLSELIDPLNLSEEQKEIDLLLARYEKGEISGWELSIDVCQWLVGLANRYSQYIVLALLAVGAAQGAVTGAMGATGGGAVGTGAGAAAGGAPAVPGGIGGMLAGGAAGALVGAADKLALAELMELALLGANALVIAAQLARHGAGLVSLDEAALERSRTGTTLTSDEAAREQAERDEHHEKIAEIILQLAVLAAMFYIGGIAARFGKKLVTAARAYLDDLAKASSTALVPAASTGLVPAAAPKRTSVVESTPRIEGESPRLIEGPVEPDAIRMVEGEGGVWEMAADADIPPTRTAPADRAPLDIEDAVEILPAKPATATPAPAPPLREPFAPAPAPLPKGARTPDELPIAGTKEITPADRAVEELLQPVDRYEIIPYRPADTIAATPSIEAPLPVAAPPRPSHIGSGAFGGGKISTRSVPAIYLKGNASSLPGSIKSLITRIRRMTAEQATVLRDLSAIADTVGRDPALLPTVLPGYHTYPAPVRMFLTTPRTSPLFHAHFGTALQHFIEGPLLMSRVDIDFPRGVESLDFRMYEGRFPDVDIRMIDGTRIIIDWTGPGSVGHIRGRYQADFLIEIVQPGPG